MILIEKAIEVTDKLFCLFHSPSAGGQVREALRFAYMEGFTDGREKSIEFLERQARPLNPDGEEADAETNV